MPRGSWVAAARSRDLGAWSWCAFLAECGLAFRAEDAARARQPAALSAAARGKSAWLLVGVLRRPGIIPANPRSPRVWRVLRGLAGVLAGLLLFRRRGDVPPEELVVVLAAEVLDRPAHLPEGWRQAPHPARHLARLARPVLRRPPVSVLRGDLCQQLRRGALESGRDALLDADCQDVAGQVVCGQGGGLAGIAAQRVRAKLGVDCGEDVGEVGHARRLFQVNHR